MRSLEEAITPKKKLTKQKSISLSRFYDYCVRLLLSGALLTTRQKRQARPIDENFIHPVYDDNPDTDNPFLETLIPFDKARRWYRPSREKKQWGPPAPPSERRQTRFSWRHQRVSGCHRTRTTTSGCDTHCRVTIKQQQQSRVIQTRTVQSPGAYNFMAANTEGSCHNIYIYISILIVAHEQREGQRQTLSPTRPGEVVSP